MILTPLASLPDDICFLTWIWRINFSSLDRRSCFLQPETTRQAYDLLAVLWQDETDYVWKHSMTRTLKQELMSSQERGKRKQECRSRLLKLMRQIQVRKQMSSGKDANGVKITEPGAIAKALKAFRGGGGIMRDFGVTEDTCYAYKLVHSICPQSCFLNPWWMEDILAMTLLCS